MPFYRNKHSFTSGEITPLMYERVDFERFKNGCKILENMFCATQGPAVRRPGFKFVFDLNTLADIAKVRLVPFIFNEEQAYVMVFYEDVAENRHMVLASSNSSGEDYLVAGQGTPCEYESESFREFVNTGDYVFNYPAGATVNGITVWHVDDSESKIDLVITSDYTVSYDDPAGEATVNIPSLTVGGGTLPADDGRIYALLEIEVDAVPSTQVVTLDLPSGWDVDNFDYAQSADEMYITQAGLPPHIIRRHDHACWELVQISFASQPDDWSDEYGWPERVTFHQQRLVFAANLIRRQTVWMSKAGDFNDFGTNSGDILDSDAVTFTLDSGTQNKIQWITSGKSLHVGTMGNEWTVVGNDQSSLTPSNILAQRQTNNGSEPNKPLLVGLTTLFIERHGRTVNEFVYDYTYDSYKTSDMAILCPHITEFYSISDWAYQQTPDSIIWAVREDGHLIGITYQRQHKVVGWHRHETQGVFKACSVIPGQTREDDLWVVVTRETNGDTRWYLEKLEDWFKSEDAIDGRFLDSHVVYENATAFTTVSGLDHLIGEEVDVLADGTVHPSVIVSSEGTITLNNSYNHVVVGFGYISEVRPTLTDVDTNSGSSRGRTQRITNVMIDLYRSLGMYIGRQDREDGEYEEEIPFRVPGDLTGSAVPLYTGWYKWDYPEGFDEESEYFLRQKQPLPFTVRCVVDEVEVYD